MTIKEPVEVRKMIIEGLRRSLLGPTDELGVEWHGEALEPKDPSSPNYVEEPFPVGPWLDASGREIIHQDPFKIYSVGVVFPHLSESDRDFLTAEIDPDAEDDENVAPDLVELDGKGAVNDSAEIEDEVLFDPIFQGPRSISFSVRPSSERASFDVGLRCGVYSPFPVQNHRTRWWVRDQINRKVSVSVGQSVPVEVRPGFSVLVGITKRFDDSGSPILTFWLRNEHRVAENQSAAEFALFQTQLTCDFKDLLPINISVSESADSLELLYRDVKLYAIGHGCGAVVSDIDGEKTVSTDVLPTVDVFPLSPDVVDSNQRSYRVGMLDLAAVNSSACDGINKLILDYGAWITSKRSEVSELDDEFKKIGSIHLDACEKFLTDIKSGWELFNSDPDVKKCLCAASKAMNQQRGAYNSPLREVVEDKTSELGYSVPARQPRSQDQESWRPFQIAFILASLKKIIDVDSRDSLNCGVDVIWMPTGGGKTEAYLGLAAFTILWTRQNNQKQLASNALQKSSMKVLMRYTYRLLTVQQVARAASMICALELIRDSDPDYFGTNDVLIGAWLGSAVTPNSRKTAKIQLKNLINDRRDTSRFLLKKCPWCGCEIGKRIGKQILGYKEAQTSSKETRVLAYCPDPTCNFHLRTVQRAKATFEVGLPVLEIDEDIYAKPPDFLIATVDKIARLAWNPESHRLFGLKNGMRVSGSPELFIQDELHLISGPLGSIDGVFEIALEELCKQDGGRSPVYVASTATTKNYEDQIRKLYYREGRLIPPPGLSIDDSFFSKRDFSSTPKTYVAVCATGSYSGLDIQNSVLASLSYQAAVLGPTRLDYNTDPWWTNVVFFSSRRSLGLLISLMDTSFHKRISRLRALSGRRSGRVTPTKDSADRYASELKELTATSSEDVNEVFDSLERVLPDKKTVDICFATSMVEVGLDVSRLGLMTVIGQPKSSSQYIQASGRVGRSSGSPGLVVSVLKPTNPRDLSHYEGFRFWHDRLYASVESASVTPFTTRALERSLPSFMAILLRARTPSVKVIDALPAWNEVSQIIFNRLGQDQVSKSNVSLVLDELLRLATAPAASQYVWDSYVGEGSGLMFSAENAVPVDRQGTPMWFVLNSMRSVDPDSMLQFTLSSFQGNGAANPPDADENGLADEGEAF
jgi:hypothetical protein